MADEDKKNEWIRLDGENASTANLRPDILEEAQRKIEQCDRAVAEAHANSNRPEEGAQLVKLGQACFNLGQAKRAIESYEQALSIFGELGDLREQANCHSRLGLAYLALKDAKNVLMHHMQACALYDRAGDRATAEEELCNIARLYSFIRQPDKAIEYYQYALTVSRELGDREREANALNSLGVVYLEIRQVKSAIGLLEQALALYQQVGNRKQETNALLNLGTTYAYLRQSERALEYFNQALAISRETGERDREALILRNSGAIYFAMKNLEKAKEVTQSSIRIYDQIGGPGADAAREQLDNFSNYKTKKTQFLIFIPVGLIITVLILIFSNIKSCTGNVKPTRTNPVISSNLSQPLPGTGSIKGMILDKNRASLVNALKGQLGIIALVCPGDAQGVECLHQNDKELDLSVLIASICDANNRATNCLLHWGQSAARITADGSYTLNNIPPGQYELDLIIIDSGLAITIGLINIPPVKAGEVVKYDFVTK
jgi:tetratricopeptide (TPR) repeat protein